MHEFGLSDPFGLIGSPIDVAYRERLERLHQRIARLEAENARLREQIGILLRVEGGKYFAWAKAGGPQECEHGYAKGIPCPACDVINADAIRREFEGGGKEKDISHVCGLRGFGALGDTCPACEATEERWKKGKA